MFSVIDNDIVTSPNKLVLKWFLELPTILLNVLKTDKMCKYDVKV